MTFRAREFGLSRSGKTGIPRYAGQGGDDPDVSAVLSPSPHFPYLLTSWHWKLFVWLSAFSLQFPPCLWSSGSWTIAINC